ncbi:unnamed protein product [Candida verbasci]|uniref:Calcineurin-like phosphoesterase domain-containing protein n=1 Tax=Candida verbasci TaxID=1227364 RepID=A0A9W4TV26_9ASCO|nr:unnamed protein product [Candida verbasci]
MLFVPIVIAFAVTSFAFTVPGYSSLQRQALEKRADDITDDIFLNLDIDDINFIDYNLLQLSKFNGTTCNVCKGKFKYARDIIDQNPDKEHLVTLMLYKDCLATATYSDSCGYTNFFITTKSDNFEHFNEEFDSGITSGTSVNFLDNDFLNVIKNFNMSSEIDLEYYCHFKNSRACELPKTPDVEELFNIESWWPAKKNEYNSPPVYKNNSEKFNVLHITDFHIQPRYQVGAEGNCTNYPCGIPESYNKVLPSKNYNFTTYYKNLDPTINTFEFSFYPNARYDDLKYEKGDYYDFVHYRGWNFQNSPATSFGAYLSDAPELLMNNSLVEIANLHKNKSFEIALFTGDLIDHDSSHCTPNITKNTETLGFNLIKRYLNNIPLMPSLGNHDSFPYAQVAPLEFDQQHHYQYNIEEMVNLWVNNEYFPEKDANDLKKHYSGFSYVTNRGLKIIGLNSNAYYTDNLWAYLDQTTNPDLFGQWKFLVDELVESESKGQRVWIMAHIPSNNFDVLPIQSHIFAKIVKRFSPYTIAKDQFSILYSTNATTATEEDIINMSWVAQSVTPYTNFNPSFRWYEVENESFNIINAYNYYTQLNETFTNNGEEPVWGLEYSARDAYDPNHEWPQDAPLNGTFWHRYVAKQLWNTTDIAFNQKFMNYKYRLSPLTPNCTDQKYHDLSYTCYNDNNCFLYFLADDNMNCQK